MRPGPQGPCSDAELVQHIKAVLAESPFLGEGYLQVWARRLRSSGRPGLALRHDHGSQYISHDFQEEIAFLGITSSPAFVRAPEGNGCAERLVRIIKENLLWVKDFSTLEELRLAFLNFKRLYNDNWILQRHDYKTPPQVRQEQLQPLPQAA